MKNRALAWLLVVFGVFIVVYALATGIQQPNGTHHGILTIAPGSPQATACPALVGVVMSARISTFSGFSLYNVSGLPDYVIPPGGRGRLSYVATVRKPYGYQGPNATENRFNSTNELYFYYNSSTGTEGYENYTPMPFGTQISYAPENVTLLINQSAALNASFSVSSNAPEGTYLMSLPGGICFGGELALLTIGTKPYNGTVRYVLPA
jgi:hypothetical protein